MIVSASYRTDIPAFYGDWFRNRLKAGFVRVENPYGGKASTLSLKRPDVDGFVFWTRNIAPFLGVLDEIHAQTYPFIVSHTLTGYPKELESRTADAHKMIRAMRELAESFGPGVLVWRYDPILLSSLTPPAWHLENFAALARGLRGAADEVVVSFAQIYKKTRRNLDAAAQAHGFSWQDPPDQAKRELIGQLAALAGEQGMRLSVCCQPDLVPPGAGTARCVDPDRLRARLGRDFSFKFKGTRPDCSCAESRDIGVYETCPHGCAYCYAVGSRSQAAARYKNHDPEGEFLIAPAYLPAASTGDLFG
jgi:DNA repair photolyase